MTSPTSSDATFHMRKGDSTECGLIPTHWKPERHKYDTLTDNIDSATCWSCRAAYWEPRLQEVSDSRKVVVHVEVVTSPGNTRRSVCGYVMSEEPTILFHYLARSLHRFARADETPDCLQCTEGINAVRHLGRPAHKTVK